MESINYDFRNRNFIDTLTGLTYDAMRQVEVPAHTAPDGAPEATHRRSWLDRLDTWFWEQELASREAFLAKSADIVELEQRMRWLEQGRR